MIKIYTAEPEISLFYFAFFCLFKNLVPTLPTMQLSHQVTSPQKIYTVTCGFHISSMLTKTCKHTLMCQISGVTLCDNAAPTVIEFYVFLFLRLSTCIKDGGLAMFISLVYAVFFLGFRGNSLKKEGGVIQSVSLALVPDYCDTYNKVIVNERCMEKHTQKNTYLLCMTDDEEMLPQNERTHFRE